MSDETQRQFEYDQMMRSYHEYFQLVAKGITIYLFLIGACLTLPNTIRFDSAARLNIFREASRMFAIFMTVVALAAYGAASVGFWLIHRRACHLASSLKLASPTTWILPVCVWMACVSAVVLLFLVGRYT